MSNENFNTLVAVIKPVSLIETHRSAGPFTVFASTNDAFYKLPAGTGEGLLKSESKDHLPELLGM